MSFWGNFSISSSFSFSFSFWFSFSFVLRYLLLLLLFQFKFQMEVGTYFNKYHNYLVLSLPFGIWVFNIFGFRFPFATSSVMRWNGMMGAGYRSCHWFSFLRFHFNCIICCLLWDHKSSQDQFSIYGLWIPQFNYDMSHLNILCIFYNISWISFWIYVYAQFSIYGLWNCNCCQL